MCNCVSTSLIGSSCPTRRVWVGPVLAEIAWTLVLQDLAALDDNVSGGFRSDLTRALQRDVFALDGDRAVLRALERTGNPENGKVDAVPPAELEIGRPGSVRRRQVHCGQDLVTLLFEEVDSVVTIEALDRDPALTFRPGEGALGSEGDEHRRGIG